MEGNPVTVNAGWCLVAKNSGLFYPVSLLLSHKRCHHKHSLCTAQAWSFKYTWNC